MRIIKLNLKNINSLKEENSIDFEKYFSDSLFLITGPTGAGKSTIFDAICVALYNKTPRLKNTQEILTKKTTDGYIELFYEIDNKIYKNKWSIKRSKNKIDGTLQAPKMEISIKQGEKFEILSSKLTEVIQKTIEIVKLNFEQFSKSILLAQGDFNAFLTAKSKDKAEILEKMTGDEIYTKIGKKVYEELKNRKKEIIELETKINAIRENILDLPQDNLIKELKNKIFKNQTELENLQKEVKNQNNLIKQLEIKKSKLENKKRLQKEISDLNNKITIVSTNIKNLNQGLNAKNSQLKQKENEFNKFLEEFNKQMKMFEEVEKLNIKINNLQINKNEKQNKLNKIVTELQKENELQKKINKNEELQKEIEYLEAKIVILKFEKERANLKDGEPCPLCGALSHPYKNKFKDENIKEILKQLEEKQKELKENEKFIHKYNGIFENLKNEKTQLETEISKLNNDIQELLQQKKCEIDKNKKTQLENQKIKLEKDFNIQKNELQNIEKKLKEEEGKKQIYIEHLEKNKKELTTLEDIDESVISDLEKLKQENRENNQKIGKLQEQIKYEEKILEELKNYFTQLQEKEEKIKPYEALNNLIGDAEGKRFREFAQTITFEYLLQLANQHLKTLNNRYVLKKEKNLDVVIIDKYHLNEQRLISSLSGGETFLVSLSLALALSDMISSQIGIKSFFIDEGFGSLDQNTLNTAFILLNKIQNSGKMVGIISHVETLKNEIPLQIKIESRNGVGKIKIDK